MNNNIRKDPITKEMIYSIKVVTTITKTRFVFSPSYWTIVQRCIKLATKGKETAAKTFLRELYFTH